jgi:hypothetical protein
MTPGSEEVCGSDGAWGDPSACTFVCDEGLQACGGECKPGTPNQCSGKKVQSCQANGTWKDEQDCGSVPCTQGVCKACTPTTKQCNAGKPQTCSAGGDWVDDQANVCPFVCDTATGNCAGECVPGTDACFSGTSKRCGTNGLYNAGTVCPNICVTATGKCGGSCKPGTKQCTGSTSQTCSAAGEWGQDMACQYGCNTGTGACNTCTADPVATTCAGSNCVTLINNCGNPVVCPSANETCDGRDNDCDGKVDMADGLSLANPIVEVGPTANSRDNAEIAWAPERSLYGIAYEDTSANPAGVYFTAINQAGVQQTAPTNVGNELGNDGIGLIWGTDNFGLTWYGSNNGPLSIRFRTVGSNGSIGVIREVTDGIMARPQVARYGTGTWVVSYLDYGDGFGYFGAKTVSATGTIGNHVSLSATASNYGLIVGTASGFATANEGSANGTAEAKILTSSLGSPASLAVTGGTPALGAGPNGFAIAVTKGANQPEFYSFDSAGNASCGPVKFADANFAPRDLVGTAAGYLVVSHGSMVRAQHIKPDCSLGPLFTVDGAAGSETHVSGGTAGYGVVWVASGKVKRRFFGPKFCD